MLTDDVTSSYLKRCSLMARLTFMKAIYSLLSFLKSCIIDVKKEEMKKGFVFF